MVSRFHRIVAAAAWLVWPALAAPPLTTIQDVLYKADGTRFNGTLTITWNSFQAVDNSAIVMQSTMVKVQDGLLRVQLVPTTTATPAAAYTVTYNSDGRVQFQENWSVPASVQPLHVRDVRTSAGAVSAAPSASADTSTVTEATVVGLIADLGARPLKSPSFTPGRTAVVDSNGMIAGAAGSATDCVHVDGSSGPCGATNTPSFVDGESPAGIVDGSNTAFSLAAVPDPVASLAIYRNGMLQKAAQDYTLAGTTVTFVAGATPQPGDTLLASYRMNGMDGDSGAASYSAPQVLCSGTGQGAATTASLTLLGTCNIPAGLLAAGDRVEIRFDYAHQGSGAASIEVDWGATTLVHRDTAAGETLVTGRGSAAILLAGAQLSAESWGAALPFGASAAIATDHYSAGLTINFMGSVQNTSDAVTLNGFSVVRIP